MRRKQVDVTGTITVVDKATEEVVVPQTDDKGKKREPWEYCHYCGKVTKMGSWGGSGLEAVPGGTYWDQCEMGKIAGVPEIIRLNHIASARQFQEKYPPYKEHRPCPKCGNEHRTTAFASGGRQSIYGSNGMFIHPYIVRNCGRCTFQTYEVPLDFDPDVIFPARGSLT